MFGWNDVPLAGKRERNIVYQWIISMYQKYYPAKYQDDVNTSFWYTNLPVKPMYQHHFVPEMVWNWCKNTFLVHWPENASDNIAIFEGFMPYMGILQLFLNDFTLNSIYKTKTREVAVFGVHSRVHWDITRTALKIWILRRSRVLFTPYPSFNLKNIKNQLYSS